jgi:hypothetical protein
VGTIGLTSRLDEQNISMSQPAFPQIKLPEVVLKFLDRGKQLPNLKVFAGLIISLSLATYIVIAYWQVSIGLSIAAIVTYIFIQKNRVERRSRIAQSEVLFVPESEIYVIPLNVTNDSIDSVRAVLNNGVVQLTASSYPFDRVRETSRVKNNVHREQEIARQLSYSLKTMYQIDPKIGEFQQKIDELKQAKKLASLSEVYADKVLDYSKIISQIEETIENARQLHNECFKLIGEILIGAELAKFDPDTMSEPGEWKLQFATRANAITEQFQFLQDKEKAYAELRQ